MKQILVMKNRRHPGRYEIKYSRLDRRGKPLFRTLDAGSAMEAAAVMLDLKNRLGTPATKIFAPPEVMQYI